MATPTLTLSLKRNPAWKPNGPMDYARSVRKWGITPTDHTTFFMREGTLFRRGMSVPPETQEAKALLSENKIAAKDETEVHDAKVPAEDVQNDLEYVVPVKIGTPGITVKLDFDTGSSDLWTWSSLLRKTTPNLKNHTIYDPTKSSTSKLDEGSTWRIQYGDGSHASGLVYTDTVTLGDSVTIPNQAIEAANSLSISFLSENASDGLLGLAFPSINTISPTQRPTPMANLISESLLESPIFTAKLDKGDSEGFYTFGYVQDNVTSAPVKYTAVDSSNGFWEFPSPELGVNGKIFKRASGTTAIADTGTTLILLDDAACKFIYGAIPGARLNNRLGGWVIPKTVDANSLHDVAFSVAGTFFEIRGEDLIFADAGSGYWYGSVQSRGGNPQDIWGDVFLKRVYAIFDQTPGAPRIGFAQR